MCATQSSVCAILTIELNEYNAPACNLDKNTPVVDGIDGLASLQVDQNDVAAMPYAPTDFGPERVVSKCNEGCGDTTRKGAIAGTSAEKVKSSDCVLLRVVANLVKCRYENSIVGFFLGKDPSFLVVQNYVSNTWSKFGFEKITRNDNGVYLFKFATKSGMEQMLERGQWMIRKSPIILNKWPSNVSKERRDAFTSSMCVESWGRISFAQALIEISSDSTLKKEVIMAVLNDDDDGHIKEVIKVEEDIPKTTSKPARSSTMEENEEGFIELMSRKKNKGAVPWSFGGLRLPKPNSKVIWQQKRSVGSKGGSNTVSPSGSTNDNDKVDSGKSSLARVKPVLNTAVSNTFEVLNVVGEDVGDSIVQEP
ncbi:copia protein, partial [Tanacetum coccineum]